MAKDTQLEDDRELVRRCKEGSAEAFEELVRKYQQVILNLVYHNTGYRSDAEDIAQQVFAKIYFSLPKFDTSRPFFPWLYRIAVNQCYDELRRARRRKLVTFSELSLDDADAIDKLIHNPEPAPESADEKRETQAMLRKLLDQLPDQQRLALVLRDLEDVPYDQMAERLKCSEQAARLKVFRARARLRELVEKALRRQGKTRPR